MAKMCGVSSTHYHIVLNWFYYLDCLLVVMRELFCNKVLVKLEFLSPTPKNDYSTAFETVGATINYVGAMLTWRLGLIEPCVVRSSNGLFVIIRFCVSSDSQSAEWRYDIRRRHVIHHRLTTGGSPQDGLILRTNRRAGSYQWTWGRLLPRYVKVYIRGIGHYVNIEQDKRRLCFSWHCSILLWL